MHKAVDCNAQSLVAPHSEDDGSDVEEADLLSAGVLFTM